MTEDCLFRYQIGSTILQINILIVDDSLEDREAVRLSLAEAGRGEGIEFRFTECGKGKAGLAAWNAGSQDCILLDHHLPDMDGLEFLARLKGTEPELPIAVLLLTGSTDKSLAVAALRAGAQEYLPKRFIGPEMLLRAVQAALERFQLLASNQRIETALIENEERLRLTQEAAGIGTWDWRAGTGAVRWSTENFVLHGMDPVVGLPDHDVWQAGIHPDDCAGAAAVISDALARGCGYETEYRVLLPDGGLRWLQGRGFVTNDDRGDVSRLFGVNVDVTERRKAADDLVRVNGDLERRVLDRTAALMEENQLRLEAETQLHQAQKMESIGQLTGGVAHDFNNILAAMFGNLELARRRTVDPVIQKHLDRIQGAADRGARLTDHLLSFARKHPVHPQQCDVNQLITAFVDLLRRTIGPSVEVKLDLASGLYAVMADPHQFEMAILNLAVNARDAMPDGGTLVITTTNIAAGSPKMPDDLVRGDYACIMVRDTGTGMSTEIAARVFEPFFTTKEVGKGTGLGLSQVYGFSKQNGGTSTVTSKHGAGAAISIFMPRADAFTVALAEQPTSAEMTPEAIGRTSGLLIIDDQPDVLEAAAETLEHLGFDVIAADSGAAGLAILQGGGAVDLAVVDFGMPGMNGLEFIRQAREVQPSLRYLLLTGYADISKQADGYPVGVTVLRKPYLIAELADAVGRVLGEGATPGSPTSVLHTAERLIYTLG